MSQSVDGVVGLYLHPVGSAWRPNDLAALRRRGGNTRPIRSSNWSSNALHAQDVWVDHSAPGAELALCGSSAAEGAGLLEISLTIQKLGRR